MELKIGGVYEFSFIDKFVSLNGVYRVLEKLHYDVIVNYGISLVDNLYTRVGLDDARYKADLPGFINEPFLKLQPVSNFELTLVPTLDYQEYVLYLNFYSNIISLETDVLSLKSIYDDGSVNYTSTNTDLSEAVSTGKWTTVQYDQAVALIASIKNTFLSSPVRLPLDERGLALDNFDKLIKYNPQSLPEEPSQDDRFTTVETKDVLYIPMPILSTYPYTDLNEYAKIALAIDIGVYAEGDVLEAAAARIKEIIMTDYGIEATPRVMIYDKVWMRDSVYAGIKEIREAAKGQTINYYSECKRLTSLINDLNTKISALESIIYAAQP